MTALRAIEQSIRENRIVHLPYNHILAADLACECEDSTQNGPVSEYWGKLDEDDDGTEWRVHLDKE